MNTLRICLYCGKPLRLSMQSGALFDSDRCRSANFRLEGALAQLPSVRELRSLLLEHAPQDAHGYRLALIRPDRCVWYYPSSQRLTRRWNGTLSRRPCFRLMPFELPVVPGPEIYGVQLVTRAGEVLETPEVFYGGVFVKPGQEVSPDHGECA